jgi:DNA polymerase-3 subunit gamma/tau
MLSTSAFNALLKTLEEPPPHVKFLLATTDPQKLPITVLSRCLQFNLKRLPPSLIGERLRTILEAEKADYETGAISLLARAADGSMRDGLSLLDQMLAFGGGKVGEADARAMLGSIDRGHVSKLLDRLAERDGTGLMQCVASMDEHGPDYAQVLDELASLLQKVALKQAIEGLPADEIWESDELEAFAGRIAPDDVQLYYQIAILGRRDLPLAPEPRGGFEMVMLRMLAFQPADPEPRKDTVRGGGRTAARPTRSAAVTSEATSLPRQTAGGTASAAVDLADWHAVIGQLGLQGAARQLATHLGFSSLEGDVLRLTLDARGQALHTRQLEERVAQAVSRLAGRKLRLQLEVGQGAVETPARAEERENESRLEQARLSLDNDPTVRALKDRFGAVVQPGSIKPLTKH